MTTGNGNLNGSTLSLITYEFEWIRGVVDPISGILGGYGIAECVIRDLQKLLNFRVNLTTLDGSNPGSSDYFQSGVSQALQIGEADIAIGYFYVTLTRSQAVTPLIPILTDGFFAIFVQPVASFGQNIYAQPLKKWVWLCWTLLILTASFAALILWRPTTWMPNKILLFLESAIFTVSIMAQSGYSAKDLMCTLSTSAKLVHLSLSYLSTTIYSVFSASLLAAIVQPNYPVQNFHDLITKDYSFYAYPSAQDFIFHQHEMKNLSLESSAVVPWVSSLNAIFTQSHAHIDVGFDSVGGLRWQKRFKTLENCSRPVDQICRLVSFVRVMKSNFDVTSAFFVRKNSTLKNPFNKSILRIMESGLLFRYVHYPKGSGGQIRCPPTVKPSYQEYLGLDEIWFAFLLPGGITLISMFVLGTEFMLSVSDTFSNRNRVHSYKAL